MNNLGKSEIWFFCGSQHLYGASALEQVATNAAAVALSINASGQLPIPFVFKKLLTTPDEITTALLEANSSAECAGVVLWMHTFSPAKMWIRGLEQLQKPLCHLHTQFNKDLPWNSIDMDFMNLNQAAHGDREAGHLHTRLKLNRKVIVGHWSDPEVLQCLSAWTRAARAWHDLQGAALARFGDNMRFVSVTDGDKVAAEQQFGFSVNGYGIGDLVARVNAIADSRIDSLLEEYTRQYEIAPELQPSGSSHAAFRYSAKLELGLKDFLEQGNFKGFTTTFEDLHGLEQLPGLAVQRLMAQGYGFGAEGDWKTAALLRAMKVMGHGLTGGTSFMEDYTYHLEVNNHLVLGAHMLEVCESIAATKPRLEIHPLGIGGKSDPVRSVFNAPAGTALNASLVDLGNRFRLIVNSVTAIEPPPMPNLPVARAVWQCQPDFKTACAAWIYAGGAHHTAYSYCVTAEMLEDFATMTGIEILLIDQNTKIRDFKLELRSSQIAWGR